MLFIILVLTGSVAGILGREEGVVGLFPSGVCLWIDGGIEGKDSAKESQSCYTDVIYLSFRLPIQI